MKVSLTDICDFQGGTQPPKDEWIDQPAQGYVRMLQIRDFTQSDKNYIEYVKDTGKLKTCIEDDILIGRYGASIGKILTGLAGAYNVAIVKTIPDEKVVSKKYLYWYLNSQYFQRFISNVGSRAAQAGFNKNDLGAAQIPLVDKERQEEICEVLEKANKLISLRKQQLAKLEELVKARFVEMFGDPVSNPKHWITLPLLELGCCKNGMNFHKGDTGVDIQCLGVGDFRNKTIIRDITGLPFVSLNEMPDSEYFLRDNDIVFVRSNGNKELVGRCLAIYPGDVPVTYSGFCIRYRLTSTSVIIPYLLQVLKTDSVRKRMAGRGANIQNLNQQTLSQLLIPLPPLSLQNDFAAFVERVDQQKQTVQQSLEKLELLKKALMQEYFG